MNTTTSSRITSKWKAAVAAAIVLSAGAASAAPTASDKCEAAKNKLNIRVKNGQFFWASHEVS